jgi:hypothetical protein
MKKTTILLILIFLLSSNLIYAERHKLYLGAGMKQLKFDNDWGNVNLYGVTIGGSYIMLSNEYLEFNVHPDLSFLTRIDSKLHGEDVVINNINGSLGVSVGNAYAPFQIKVGIGGVYDYFDVEVNDEKENYNSGGVKGFTTAYYNFVTGETKSFAGVKYEYTFIFDSEVDASQTGFFFLGTSF